MEALLAVQKCRSWEEDFYWKHLKTVHFFRILPDDFHERLLLPRKFAGNLLLDLPDKVPLVGPGGAKWDVTLTKTNNVTIVGDGWKEFVKAHALEATFLLMFKYKQSVGFEVLIFDPETSCEKENGYFVKNDDKLTVKQQQKRSSAEAFGTSTEVLEDDDNFDDSDFVTSKRVSEDPTWMGETSNKQAPRKWSSDRGKQGGHRGRGRRGRRSSSHLKACSVLMSKRKKTVKEQHVVESREIDLELGHSHGPCDIRGVEEHICAESGEGKLKIVQFPKFNNTAGLQHGMPNRNQTGGDQPIVEKTESCRELGCSQKSSEIRGKKTKGSEPVKELNSRENGGSIREIVHRLRFYETRGKKLKESEAAKEQQRIVHSPMSIEVIEKAPYEIEGRSVETDTCKSSGSRGRPRKQIAPRKNNLVYENVNSLMVSNANDAVKELNGIDTGASNVVTEMVCSDKTIKTRGQRRRQLTPDSPSKLT